MIHISVWESIYCPTLLFAVSEAFLDFETLTTSHCFFRIKHYRQVRIRIHPLHLSAPPPCKHTHKNMFPRWLHFLYRGYFSLLGFPSSLSACHLDLSLLFVFLLFRLLSLIFSPAQILSFHLSQRLFNLILNHFFTMFCHCAHKLILEFFDIWCLTKHGNKILNLMQSSLFKLSFYHVLVTVWVNNGQWMIISKSLVMKIEPDLWFFTLWWH